MASVFRRSGGRLIIKWKDATGVWRTRESKAGTKAEAHKVAVEMERRAERQRLGLEPLASDSSMTLGALCRWWLKHKCPAGSEYTERKRLERHVINHAVAQTTLDRITSEHFERLFEEMQKGELAPASVNKLRAILHAVFARATKAKHWIGPNPLAATEPRRVPRRTYATLRAEEVPLFLQQVPAEWRDFMATALWTGMRKGELCGLLKTDVDLDRRVITVARSYDHATTKGHRTDELPIADPLLPYLTHAIENSTSAWVFPAPSGGMRSHKSAPQKILKTALKWAGLSEGYEHVCRRCKATKREGHTVKAQDSAPRKCSSCGMALWCKAIPRQMRFHDLRHTTATLLLRAGVDSHRVQRIMRHADMRTTLGIYGHLNVDDLRPAMESIAPQTLATGTTGQTEAETEGFGAPVVRDDDSKSGNLTRARKNPSDCGELRSGRSRDRTYDSCRVNPFAGISESSRNFPSVTSGSYAGASTNNGPEGATRENFGAPVVQTVVPPFRVVRGAADRMLTVRDVAALLSVSTATVYRLANEGRLASVRVLSGAIRFERVALEAFVVQRRAGHRAPSE